MNEEDRYQYHRAFVALGFRVDVKRAIHREPTEEGLASNVRIASTCLRRYVPRST